MATPASSSSLLRELDVMMATVGSLTHASRSASQDAPQKARALGPASPTANGHADEHAAYENGVADASSALSQSLLREIDEVTGREIGADEPEGGAALTSTATAFSPPVAVSLPATGASSVRGSPAGTSSGGGLRGVKVRFLPLSILYVYTGVHSTVLDGPSTYKPSTMLLPRSGAIATWVLVTDQTGPACIVHAAAVSTCVRRVGLQLADLRDNILVRAPTAAGADAAPARTLLDYLRETASRKGGATSPSPPDAPGAAGDTGIASQVVVRAVLTPLSSSQLQRLTHNRVFAKLAASVRVQSGNDDEDVLQSARELLARGHDSLVSAPVLARLRAQPAVERTENSTAGASPLRMSARAADSTVAATPSGERRGSVSSETSDTSAASLSAPGQRLSRPSTSTPARAGPRGGVMRPSPADCAQSPPRAAVFRYAEALLVAGGGGSSGRPTPATQSPREPPSATMTPLPPARSPSAHSVRSTGTDASARTIAGQASKRVPTASTAARSAARTPAATPSRPAPRTPTSATPAQATSDSFAAMDVSAADSRSVRPGDIVLTVDGLSLHACTCTHVLTYMAGIAVDEGAMLRVARPVAMTHMPLSNTPAASATTTPAARVTGMRVLQAAPRAGGVRAASAQPASRSRGVATTPVARGANNTSSAARGRVNSGNTLRPVSATPAQKRTATIVAPRPVSRGPPSVTRVPSTSSANRTSAAGRPISAARPASRPVSAARQPAPARPTSTTRSSIGSRALASATTAAPMRASSSSMRTTAASTRPTSVQRSVRPTSTSRAPQPVAPARSSLGSTISRTTTRPVSASRMPAQPAAQASTRGRMSAVVTPAVTRRATSATGGLTRLEPRGHGRVVPTLRGGMPTTPSPSSAPAPAPPFVSPYRSAAMNWAHPPSHLSQLVAELDSALTDANA